MSPVVLSASTRESRDFIQGIGEVTKFRYPIRFNIKDIMQKFAQ